MINAKPLTKGIVGEYSKYLLAWDVFWCSGKFQNALSLTKVCEGTTAVFVTFMILKKWWRTQNCQQLIITPETLNKSHSVSEFLSHCLRAFPHWLICKGHPQQRLVVRNKRGEIVPTQQATTTVVCRNLCLHQCVNSVLSV